MTSNWVPDLETSDSEDDGESDESIVFLGDGGGGDQVTARGHRAPDVMGLAAGDGGGTGQGVPGVGGLLDGDAGGHEVPEADEGLPAGAGDEDVSPPRMTNADVLSKLSPITHYVPANSNVDSL